LNMFVSGHATRLWFRIAGKLSKTSVRYG
jgi:hypothetical protein